MRLAWIAVAIAGCADPVVDLTFKLPTGSWDTSCIDHVQIYADSPGYETDPTNQERNVEIQIGSQADFNGLVDAMRGQFNVPIPDDLAAVEVYGWQGKSGYDDSVVVSQQVFNGFAKSIGQSPLEVELKPTVDCRKSATTYTVRPLDVVKYAATPDCTMAKLADGAVVVEVGSISPKYYEDGLIYWGDPKTASLSSGATTVTPQVKVGDGVCYGVRMHNGDTPGTIGCMQFSTGACGGSGEVELPYIDPNYASNSVDTSLATQYGAMTVGLVVKTGTHTPVAGATVTPESDLADSVKIQYVDVQANGQKLVVKDGATSTTASGLFVIYSDSLTSLTVTQGSLSKTLTIGGAMMDTYDSAPVGAVTVLLQ